MDILERPFAFSFIPDENTFLELLEALDIDQDFRNTTVTNKMIFDYIKNHLEFTQLIWENGTDENPGWVHVSYDANNLKKQMLKLKNGKYSNYE